MELYIPNLRTHRRVCLRVTAVGGAACVYKFYNHRIVPCVFTTEVWNLFQNEISTTFMIIIRLLTQPWLMFLSRDVGEINITTRSVVNHVIHAYYVMIFVYHQSVKC